MKHPCPVPALAQGSTHFPRTDLSNLKYQLRKEGGGFSRRLGKRARLSPGGGGAGRTRRDRAAARSCAAAVRPQPLLGDVLVPSVHSGARGRRCFPWRGGVRAGFAGTAGTRELEMEAKRGEAAARSALWTMTRAGLALGHMLLIVALLGFGPCVSDILRFP
jgi:hypothetical protein